MRFITKITVMTLIIILIISSTVSLSSNKIVHSMEYRTKELLKNKNEINNPYFPNIEFPTPIDRQIFNITFQEEGRYYLVLHSPKMRGVINITDENGTLIHGFHSEGGSTIKTENLQIRKKGTYEINASRYSGYILLLRDEIINNPEKEYHDYLNWKVKSYKDPGRRNNNNIINARITVHYATISVYLFDTFFNLIQVERNITSEAIMKTKPYRVPEDKWPVTNDDYIWTVVNEEEVINEKPGNASFKIEYDYEENVDRINNQGILILILITIMAVSIPIVYFVLEQQEKTSRKIENNND